MTDSAFQEKTRNAQLDFFDDQHPPKSDFLRDVLSGFKRAVKTVPPKYFYDAPGSALFDSITELPEYYVARTELKTLAKIGPELAKKAGTGAVVIEPGSGSSVKIRSLLDALDQPAGYVGLDISRQHLIASCEDLAEDHPDLNIGAVCADFTSGLDLDHLPLPEGRRIIFFPGSTIGNFEPEAARSVLAGFRDGMRPGDAVLIGADRVKCPVMLEAAYDDKAGVTAAFNLNLLTRINTELNGTIPTGQFKHLAIWNAEQTRIEMHLEALTDVDFTIAGEAFSMSAGERLHTENSHKFTPESFKHLAEQAGFELKQSWTDSDDLFSLHWLEPSAKA
jgi:L-histidine N-alpha-methyltransferase